MGESLAAVVELNPGAARREAVFGFDGTGALAQPETNSILEEAPFRHLSLVPSILSDAVEEISAHPPEMERYGRSLSTIRRLGTYMIGRMISEIIVSPEADQARVEFYTSVQEGFGTDMELGGGLEVRDFDRRPVINGKVMAKDLKTAVSDMTDAGIVCAEETAKHDRRFFPQLVRSKWDHMNALAVDAMARGETPYNTRIVVSPFPEEAAAKSGNEYWRGIGYVPHLKRGFVQLYHAGNDELIAGSLSFDGSNKQRLREVFTNFGIEIPDDEVTDNWLEYAITDTLSQDKAEALAIAIADMLADPSLKKSTNTVDVTDEYGQIMDQVFNESYVHICESLVRECQTKEVTSLVRQLANNTQHYNARYKTALQRMSSRQNMFTADDAAVLHELLVYSTIEMMRAFHIQTTTTQNSTKSVVPREVRAQVASLQNVDPAAFRHMLADFGAEGAKNNRSYSACGLAISAGDDIGELQKIGTLRESNPQSAFGGALVREKEDTHIESDVETDEYGPLEFECTEGCKNKRPRGKLISECKNKKWGCKGSVGC